MRGPTYHGKTEARQVYIPGNPDASKIIWVGARSATDLFVAVKRFVVARRE